MQDVVLITTIEPTGIARIKEAIETTDWSNVEDDFELSEEALLGDGELDYDGTFAAEEAEMNMEFMGLKTAIAGGSADDEDQEEQVEEMARMMARLQAIKGSRVVSSIFDFMILTRGRH